jgi:hypothetical protein
MQRYVSSYASRAMKAAHLQLNSNLSDPAYQDDSGSETETDLTEIRLQR